MILPIVISIIIVTGFSYYMLSVPAHALPSPTMKHLKHAMINPSKPDEIEEFLKDQAICNASLPLAMAQVIRDLQTEIRELKQETPYR